MIVRRVVLVEEINSFGLSEKEILEIAGRAVREYANRTGGEWELSDVVVLENSKLAKIAIERYGRFGDIPNFLVEEAKELFAKIERALGDYAYLKQFMNIYNDCNGQKSDTKEVMRKVGIPVIS